MEILEKVGDDKIFWSSTSAATYSVKNALKYTFPNKDLMLYNNFIDFVGQVRPFSNSYFANIMILLYIEAKTDNKRSLKATN